MTWKQFTVIGGAMYGGGMLVGILAAMTFLNRPTPKVDLAATVAAVITGAIGGLAASRFSLLAPHPGRPLTPAVANLYSVTAFSLVIGVFLLAATLLVEGTSYFTDDKDREWWARSGQQALARPEAFSQTDAFAHAAAFIGSRKRQSTRDCASLHCVWSSARGVAAHCRTDPAGSVGPSRIAQ